MRIRLHWAYLLLTGAPRHWWYCWRQLGWTPTRAARAVWRLHWGLWCWSRTP